MEAVGDCVKLGGQNVTVVRKSYISIVRCGVKNNMLQKPLIGKEYIDSAREIRCVDQDEVSPERYPTRNSIIYGGQRWEMAANSEEKEFLQGEEFEVMGWVERTSECPYDFIIRDTRTGKHYLANLRGRSDGFPLFAVQNGKQTCARSKMGSEWNCRLCVKYFGTVCEGR